MESRDVRWRGVLKEIEKLGASEITTQEQLEEIGVKAGASDILEDFRRQLYTYLDAFTEGAAGNTVLTHGWMRSFECWRRFADRGRSRRPEHVHRLLTEIL